jgi:PAS domain S-box-containing protein
MALEAGRMGTYRVNLRTNEQQWSSGQYQIFGLPPAATPPSRDQFLAIVHPDDRHLIEFGPQDIRAEGTYLDSEFRIVRPDGQVRTIRAHALAKFDDQGHPVELIGVNRDVTEERDIERALDASEETLRGFGEAATEVLWIRDAHTLQWQYLSHAFEKIYGISRHDALRGDNLYQWRNLIHPDDREQALANIQRVRHGERVTFEFRIVRPMDGSIRWMRNADFPIRGESGDVQAIGGIGADITPFKEAEAHERMLLGELQHRVRNTLAVIRAIVRRTAESSETVEDYAMHLDGRIGAFARVEAAVTRDPTAGIDLAQLVAEEMLAHTAHEQDQVDIVGEPVRLAPKAAETIGLAIHELATNAVKHGALSSPRGHINVSWRKEDGAEPRLVLGWQESGVAIAPPRRRGFGTELLERTLAYELNARTELRYDPAGFSCRITLPLSAKILRQTARS